ncbi:hypothetical protein QMP26_23595 [Enterocloster clostridioformis]
MKIWIRGCIGAAVLALVLQPGEALDEGCSVQAQQAWVNTGATGWEQEYTDTDSRRGTLSVRCETFQGFHGTIELHMRNMAGGWKRSATLTEKDGYAGNLFLPVGVYKIESFEAQTDGRKFRCQADRTEVEIEDERIIMCRITITPESVYRLPYEDSAEAAASGTPAAAVTRSAGNERRNTEESELAGEETNQKTELQGSIRVSPLWILGILGATLCLYELYYVIKRK